MSADTTTTIEPKKVPIPRWVVKTAWRIHRFLYRASNGRLGIRNPTPDQYGLLRLRTIGRKTGKERGVILAYFEDGNDVIVIPMNGWAEPEPGWWLNLQALPLAEIDTTDGTKRVRARVADQNERARLWKMAIEGTWDPETDAFAAGRGRETQVVILEPH